MNSYNTTVILDHTERAVLRPARPHGNRSIQLVYA